MVIEEQQLRFALEGCQPGSEYRRSEVRDMAGQVKDDLKMWGHEGHDVTLERVAPFFGNPDVLRFLFWCETCHVAHVALLPRGEAA